LHWTSGKERYELDTATVAHKQLRALKEERAFLLEAFHAEDDVVAAINGKIMEHFKQLHE
jgi:hypothetical protein